MWQNEVNVKQVKEALQKKGTAVSFNKAAGGRTIINCVPAVKEAVKDVLINQGYHGFSYVTTEERIYTRILKGIDASFSFGYNKERDQATFLHG